MSSVLVMMGSESDMPTMEKGVAILREAGVDVSVASGAEAAGHSVVICGAGLSAALPGVVAAHTSLPVIGVPVSAGTLGGLDALLSCAQMPPGVPVAAVGIDNAKNAAHLALRILGVARG